MSVIVFETQVFCIPWC